jgi:hypothetical protein
MLCRWKAERRETDVVSSARRPLKVDPGFSGKHPWRSERHGFEIEHVDTRVADLVRFIENVIVIDLKINTGPSKLSPINSEVAKFATLDDASTALC